MSEITIVGSLRAQPGKEAELGAALADVIDPTHAEEGCLLYAVHQGVDDPTRFVIIEQWADQHALDVHVRSDYMSVLLSRAGDLLAEMPDSPKYAPLRHGTSPKNTLGGARA
ncbi:putative quinol monooxygenase [Herbiconiux sp. 11R-BC]|uniref:putative quinol monooxygenase n=1 Tax=Herbiconiux sp. 11R-BC TaxID=3111637 RepID=UPI003C11625D